MYLVCGEALFDLFLDPEEKLGSLPIDARAGGSPFNVAIGISRLGGQSALLTGISTDMLGDRLLHVLEHESVSVEYLLRSTRRTTLSLVGVDANGTPNYVFYGLGSADCSVTRDQLPMIDEQVRGLHFGSYSLVVEPVADALFSLAESCTAKFISVDPNVRVMVEPDLDVWRERVSQYAGIADLFKISAEDFALLYPGEYYEQRASDWIEAGIKLVIVTAGENEICSWTQRGERLNVMPAPTTVVDTVGAGDSFQAALLARIAELGDPKSVVSGLDRDQLMELISFAGNAAAITCARRGANLPQRSEICGSWEFRGHNRMALS